jgi:hypothetical protein
MRGRFRDDKHDTGSVDAASEGVLMWVELVTPTAEGLDERT